LPHATLWTGQKPRDQYRASLLNRKIDSEGYVSVNQHRGMAHSEGWPFPAWQQSGSAGFHFSIADEVFAIHNFAQQAIRNTDGWDIGGASIEGVDPVRGLRLKATQDVVTITSPAFGCGTIVAPFARLEWAASGLGKEAKPSLWSMTTVGANGNITHEQEIVRTVSPFNFKPTIGQTYTFKDQKKK